MKISKEDSEVSIRVLLDNKLIRVFDPQDGEYKNVRITGKQAGELAHLIMLIGIKAESQMTQEEKTKALLNIVMALAEKIYADEAKKFYDFLKLHNISISETGEYVFKEV
jgi:hypothetical protein